MTIIEKGFPEYLEEQRQKFDIQGCHFRRISDIVQTACVYSRFDGEGRTAPSYYKAIYCVGLFVEHFLPENTTVRIFEESTNAKMIFAEAYRELCQGTSLRSAVSKMKAAADSESLDALRIYGDLLLLTDSAEATDEIGRNNKMERALQIPTLCDDVTGLVAMCFAGQIKALMSLSDILKPGSTKWPEIKKSKKLSELLCNWGIAMMEKRAVSNGSNTYAMIELYNYYDSVHNKLYASYWLREALNRGYHVAKYKAAVDIFLKGFDSYLGGGNSQDDSYDALDKAIAYLQEIMDLGYDGAREQIQVCKKLKRDMEASTRAKQAREYRERAQIVEEQMNAYRQKLDRREQAYNFLTDDVPLTDRDAGMFFALMHDYDNALDYYGRGTLREARENSFFKKQMKKLEDEEFLRRREKASDERSRDDGAAYVDYRKFQEMALEGSSSPIFPPADKNELQNEEFVRLYADCNAYRQANNFESAIAESEKMLELFPESCMAHWMHFLAVNGIVFEESFEVYNICRMINESFLYNEDYEWIMEHSSGEDREKYQRYFSDFETRRMEYMAEQDNATLYKIVFCYCKTDAAGKKSLSASIAEKIIMRWEDSHSPQYPIHCYSSAFYGETFTETFEEARTYGALKNAGIMVIIAENEDEFFSDEMWNEWKRYYDWSTYDPDKQIIAVSTGQLSEVYKGITDSVMEIHGEDDIDRLYQLLSSKEWGLNAYLGDVYIPPEGTTENFTKFVEDCLSTRDVDYGIKAKSNFLNHVNIYGLKDPSEPIVKSESQSVIEIQAYCQIGFCVRLRKPLTGNMQTVYSLEIYNSENVYIGGHSWDFGKDNANIDQLAVTWNLKNKDNGELIFQPGIYRARVQINQEEPLDGFFKLTYNAERAEHFDKMAQDMNLVPTAEERRMPQEKMQECMREHARERYLSRWEKSYTPRHSKKSFATEILVKGIFKRKTEYRHSAEIGDDGTVYVGTRTRGNYKDLQFSFDDEGIAQEIARMRDIIEVVCMPQGLLALDARGELHYAGRDRHLKETVRQIGRAKTITEGKDNAYILTFDGQLLELGQGGVTVKEEGVKALSSKGSGKYVEAVYIDANGDVHPQDKAMENVYQPIIAIDCYGVGSAYLSDSGHLFYYAADVTYRIELIDNKEKRERMNRLKKAFGIVSFEMLNTFTIEAHFYDGRTERFALRD